VDRSLRLAIIGVVMVTMAACSSTATQSPTGPAGTPAGGATPTSAEQATPTPGETASGALPSFQLPHNAAELEALLPDTLGGVTLQKSSWSGADFVNQNSTSTELVAFLQSLGKSLSDISAAAAFSPTFDNSIFAFRVNGVDHNILISEFQKAENTGLDTPIPWTSATVGGKSVFQATTDTAGEMIYVYGVADLFFEVTSNDPAIAAEALSKLP
jgi:hypothetical protein